MVMIPARSRELFLSVTWQSDLTHQPYDLRNGGPTTIRGLESRTHRQIDIAPAEALTFAKPFELHSRSHADLDTPSMRSTAVNSQQEISSLDVPQTAESIW
jgi:hypothetical protein